MGTKPRNTQLYTHTHSTRTADRQTRIFPTLWRRATLEKTLCRFWRPMRKERGDERASAWMLKTFLAVYNCIGFFLHLFHGEIFKLWSGESSVAACTHRNEWSTAGLSQIYITSTERNGLIKLSRKLGDTKICLKRGKEWASTLSTAKVFRVCFI